jgi:predicted ATP-dependent serine protease
MEKENQMATYECDVCGMSVNATCGTCDEPLVNDSLTKDDGTSVQISKCPNDHGKIKSPMCCGKDMNYAA